MPMLGLGTWQLTHDTAATVEEALRLGYRMIDTAVDYETQPGIGEGIRRSGLDRQDFYLVTKVEENEDAYRGTVRDLRELDLDHADLMLLHRPPPGGAGQELWAGLIRAKEDGLTRDIGVSNYKIEQIEELIDATGEVPTVNQIEWTPFGWSPQMLDYCRQRRIVVQAYSPLTRAERLTDDKLAGIASEYGKSPAQVLIRWNLQRGVSAIPKANRRDHLTENLEVFDFELADTHMEQLNGLDEHWSALGPAPMYV
ncbi:aldo/keto reductase [Jiangella aurantiaca]|uniref:Aldo/keto reductase n=2 Tax=Jiangella aurantiaca TaxID=2530373 RepID=A0A4R5AC63_9ACTN|nr:aldo/keto reductase [Jiangella aurantiaca]